MAEEIKRAVCTFCHARCRLAVHVEGGRLISFEEDPTFPRQNRVSPPIPACMRLRGAKEFMYHPDRVNFPQKRAGERGEGKWKTISWDQAFDEIAAKLAKIKQKYGAEGISLTCGTGRTMGEFSSRFMNLLGSPNRIGQANICHTPAVAVATALLGWGVRHRTGKTIDIGAGAKPVTKCTFLIGLNPAHSVPPMWKSIQDGKKLGVKLIVADPRRTETAALADIHLQQRPGTDTALLMAMINTVIQEQLYDKEFVKNWCFGFDKLVERAKEYPAEKVAEISWVPAEKIKEAARMFANNTPALAVHGMGTEHLQNAIEAIHARFILTAITGNVDIEGGDYMPGPSPLVAMSEIAAEKSFPEEQKKKQLGADRFKLLSWPGRDLVNPYVKKVWGMEISCAPPMSVAHGPLTFRAMLTGKPYPIKGVITFNSNPMVTQANTKLVYKALKKLDTYVVFDFWKTPSAELADYILPVASWMEKPWLMDNYGEDTDFYAGEAALPASIPGEYDHKTDYEIFRELGLRLGQEGKWPWKTYEECFDYRLSPMGMTLKEFIAKGGYHFPLPKYKKYEKQGFGTPSGKVELYSNIFEKLGYDPLPNYQESHENPISTPEIAKDYPLILITGGRFHPFFHSEHRQISVARNKHPDPILQIHPETAKKLDIAEGDWAWVETLRGRVRFKCLLFQGIDPRVVHAQHGWWFPELPGEEPWLHGVWESNINVTTDEAPEHCNRLSGGWPLKTGLCKVYKVKKY